MAILRVRDLSTTFDIGSQVVTAVDKISFDVEKGKTLGIVGESGSGKSVTSLSIMRLLPVPMGQSTGQIFFEDTDILSLPVEDMLKIRGYKISMIFQEPMTALNPVHTIGQQLMETCHLHFPKMTKEQTFKKSVKMLEKVGIPAPEKRINEFPHQLSGGMRQRVVIAIALSCEPDILIADEPTTALDVTIQAQILDLMKELQKKNGMSIVFITHDLGVVAEMCDDVAVMYAGRVVEQAKVEELFAKPRHPYTHALLESIPRFEFERKSKLQTIEGMVPALADLPEGCRFGPRSTFEHKEESYKVRPPMKEISEGHFVEWCECCQKGLEKKLSEVSL
ncbi:MAG: ABC transporter ATP-binding protein [Lentisphaerales bacterium]|nr:ABC transporter ATP-binding protein [Lentisphaerales bacterium]